MINHSPRLSGILPVSRRKQNEVDDFSKSTSRLKSTNRDSSNPLSKMSGFTILVGTFGPHNVA